MPPSKSLMASAKASIVSISKWLVGSSRSNMWGVCHANLWSKKLKFNMRKEQKRLIRVLVTLLVDLEQVVGILYRYLMPDYFFQKLPYSAKKLGPVELTWALKSFNLPCKNNSAFLTVGKLFHRRGLLLAGQAVSANNLPHIFTFLHIREFLHHVVQRWKILKWE